MNKTLIAVAMAAALTSSNAVLADDAAAAAPAAPPPGPFALADFSANLYFTTDYMYRGISFTGGPAIQGDVDWTWNGFYALIWGSNSKAGDHNYEIDYDGGYRWSWAGFSFDVGGLYYTNPNDNCYTSFGLDAGNALCPDTDYFEAQGIASYGFNDAWLKPNATLKYNYSPDFYGSDGEGHALEGDLALTVPTGLYGDVGVLLAGGWQTVAGDKSTNAKKYPGVLGGLLLPNGQPMEGYDYTWWRAGVNKTIAGFLIDVSYYGTSRTDSLKTLYADAPQRDGLNLRDLVSPKVVLTVTRSFTFP